MYSPFQAVYGHDRTYVRRMTVEEYTREIEEEERDVRGLPLHGSQPPRHPNRSQDTSTSKVAPLPLPQYELRRAALSSRDPNVVFSSKYPTYDRLGRELCVLYQMQDMAVEQEHRRLRSGGDACRRSGVRLSAELPLHSLNTTLTRPEHVLDVYHSGAGQEEEEEEQGVAGSSDMDVTVSTMSRVSSFMPSHGTSARPSDFSIYRDSARPPLMLAQSIRRVRSLPMVSTGPVPLRERELAGGASQPPPDVRGYDGAEKEKEKPRAVGDDRAHAQAVVLRHRQLADGTADGPGRQGRSRSRSHKRSREEGSQCASSGLRRVRVADECAAVAVASDDGVEAEGRGEEGPVRARGGSGRMARTWHPPVTGAPAHAQHRTDSGDPTVRANTSATTAVLDRVRLTTVRDSVASRITKQLFRSTAGPLARGTTTYTHPHPIPGVVYGHEAPAIPAHTVAAAVEQNFAGCGSLSGTFTVERGRPVPELRCGRIVQLGDRWFQLTAFFLVAGVYEVVEVEPPVPPPGEAAGARESNAVKEGEEAQSPLAANADGVPDTTATEASAGVAPAAIDSPSSTRARSPTHTPSSRADEEAPLSHPAPVRPPAAGDARCQHLLYRWRGRHIPHAGDESRRAAAGLSLCAPAVCVSGFAFANGEGLTLLTMPCGYRAAPMSGLPLGAASYRTLLKLTLRVLSSMVARRVVHGNLTSLGEMLLAFPQAGSPCESGGEAGDAPPLIAPVHWERAVDFSMFVDRNAGRTVPFDSEDGSERPLLSLGKDLSTALQCFLEHRQAAELTSEQYVLLQRLIVMAAEPTQVANYLVQMKNLMSSLATDLPALRQAYDAAVVFYDS